MTQWLSGIVVSVTFPRPPRGIHIQEKRRYVQSALETQRKRSGKCTFYDIGFQALVAELDYT